MLLIAAALAIQLEAGVSAMQKPEDDVYVEYRLPNADDRIGFTSPVVGIATRFDVGRVVITTGWRSLGNQHVAANIIGDADYAHGHWDSAYKARWYSTGSESQLYAEFGYKLGIGGWDLVPSAGVADNRTTWHYQVYWHGEGSPGAHWLIRYPDQHGIAPFVGLSLERGPVGIGAYLLQTAPPHTNNDFGGQGSNSIYLRATYAFKVH